MSYRIQVRYPVGRVAPDAKLVLRTGPRWDRDIEATQETDEGADFDIDAPGRFLEYKPCLLEGDRLTWSVGTNYFACSSGEPRQIYPCFRSSTGRLTGRFTVRATDGAEHDVRLYLPPGYDENTLKRYPTLYVHDGANAFVPEEASGGVPWEIDDTLDLLDSMSVVDKVIVVAIYTPGERRARDYTAQGYDAYEAFIADTLVPRIDAAFRTLDGPAYRATLGSSLGGVVAMHLAWSRPDCFGMAACMSSTFGLDDDLFHRVAEMPLPNVRLYLDSGWPNDNFEVTRRMALLLAQRGLQLGCDFVYYAFPRALHSERYWRDRVHLPFQFFFSRLAEVAPPLG